MEDATSAIPGTPSPGADGAASGERSHSPASSSAPSDDGFGDFEASTPPSARPAPPAPDPGLHPEAIDPADLPGAELAALVAGALREAAGMKDAGDGCLGPADGDGDGDATLAALQAAAEAGWPAPRAPPADPGTVEWDDAVDRGRLIDALREGGGAAATTAASETAAEPPPPPPPPPPSANWAGWTADPSPAPSPAKPPPPPPESPPPPAALDGGGDDPDAPFGVPLPSLAFMLPGGGGARGDGGGGGRGAL